METKKLISKYAVILLVYVILIHFVQPYGLKAYYSAVASSPLTSATVNTIQSYLYALEFTLNLIIMIIVLLDSKQKKAIDFLIALIILFSAETGIILFLIWQIYKTEKIKYEA
ncbi:MAG: hypothetical protein IPJ66_09300 [Bacteroidetes bacterium]|nr:hypothetical protein [Bacteroidota bacterium]